jgi:hypothetical protein
MRRNLRLGFTPQPMSPVRPAFRLVDQPGIRTRLPYLIDFIQITPLTKQSRNDKIKHLYVEKGLSSNQIAEKLGVSKTSVIQGMHGVGIRPGARAPSTDPLNYRCHTPPYGYQVKNGHLIIYKPEIKICRLVVQLIGNQKYSASKAARELTARHFVNKQGTTYWDHRIVKRIFNRWNGKL